MIWALQPPNFLLLSCLYNKVKERPLVEKNVKKRLNERPLVTYILLCYKQAQYILAAVQSALEQDYDNIEFILSDDQSPDNSFDLIKAEVEKRGMTDKVILNRNENNLGLVPHLNKLLRMAKGEIIVLAAGDDISLPHRVKRTVELLVDPEISFVSFNDEVIDAKGDTTRKGTRVNYDGVKVFSIDEYIAGQRIPFSGASRGFRRSTYDFFGDLNMDCPTEDTPYIIRGLLLGKTAISSEIAIKYRVHGENLSGPKYLPYMDISNITKQYHADSNYALSENKIDSTLHSKLSEWININNNKRVNTNLRQKLSNTNFEFGFLFQNILTSNCFSVREKLGLFKLCVYQIFS